jgi:uncharacterized protein (DUF1800 family)
MSQLDTTVKLGRGLVMAVAAAALLVACGGGNKAVPGENTEPSLSTGQVQVRPAPRASFYAASRFAEQASFGATPALIAELQAKGFAQWIDEQFAAPASQIDPTPFLHFTDPSPPQEFEIYQRLFPQLALASGDQLRLRVTWALSNFIVVSDKKGDYVGMMYWINMLQQRGLGRYDELLHAVSVSPFMGQYLDNIQNRPQSAECPHCAPNENYARELMQLFSLGVFKLNPDGTAMKDAQGRLQETYTQRDVEELARVLTGWRQDPEPPNRPNRNWANWGKPLVPTVWPPERDSGSKRLLGAVFPAGQSQDKDLRDAIGVLMAHPNIAPFVATRMIQALVKSNPTPAYVSRVAAAFRNNGSGVAGDMKAVVKAVLLDAEARAGDNPATARADDGKFREPFLFTMALWRGLGCAQMPRSSWNAEHPAVLNSQRPFSADSVFGYYAPTDRAPGSNLLAPEQRLLTPVDVRDRLSLVEHPKRYENNTASYPGYANAGCQLDALQAAFTASPKSFNDWTSQRFFRGAMPPALRANAEQLMREANPPWNRNDPREGSLRILGYVLSSPAFGVSK